MFTTYRRASVALEFSHGMIWPWLQSSDLQECSTHLLRTCWMPCCRCELRRSLATSRSSRIHRPNITTSLFMRIGRLQGGALGRHELHYEGACALKQRHRLQVGISSYDQYIPHPPQHDRVQTATEVGGTD